MALVLLAASPAGCRAPDGHGVESARQAEARVPLFDDLGDHHHSVTTTSARAQRYFDQGLRLVYAFNHDEAIRSFQEAARLDPSCAMAHWGIAYALGPNINWPGTPARHRRAWLELRRARDLLPRVSSRDRAYIHALSVRYADPPPVDRQELDVAFANRMRALAREDLDDADATTLFAEALMVLRPWAYWTPDGRPTAQTTEIVRALEGVLRRDPEHPGANHHYIHAIEASPHPERGLGAAERLERLMPGAGHMVHMSSHIYMRTGRYDRASRANERAIVADEVYLARMQPVGMYPMMYVPHNIHFLAASAAMEGRSRKAIGAARRIGPYSSPRLVQMMPAVEMFGPTLVVTLARFGRWNEVLAEPPPADGRPYGMGMWRYARGLALAATGQLDQAEREHIAVADLAARAPRDIIIGLASAPDLLGIAAHVLQGDIAARRGATAESLSHLQQAVHLEDGLPYDEPPPWYQPTRHFLGPVLLEAGEPEEAEAVYREDLRRNPENGWALRGLLQSLRAQDALTEARLVELRLQRAWVNADVVPPSSRF